MICEFVIICILTCFQIPFWWSGHAAVPEPERRREERVAGCEREDLNHSR